MGLAFVLRAKTYSRFRLLSTPVPPPEQNGGGDSKRPIAGVPIPSHSRLMSFLTFRYRYDGTPTHVLDDFGWLEMRVVTESRSGVGGFWVQWQDVKEFGEKLSAYPIDPNAPLAEQWGYSENGEYEKVLGVEIAPANARGGLKVRVEIADQDDPTDCVKTSFQTNYPDLAAFQLEIAQLMAGEIEEARLSGR